MSAIIINLYQRLTTTQPSKKSRKTYRS